MHLTKLLQFLGWFSHWSVLTEVESSFPVEIKNVRWESVE